MKSPLHSARLLHLRREEIFSAIGLNSHKRARLIGRCWLAGNQTSGKLDIASHHRLHLAFLWHRIYFFLVEYIYMRKCLQEFCKVRRVFQSQFIFLEQEKWGRIFLYCIWKVSILITVWVNLISMARSAINFHSVGWKWNGQCNIFYIFK